MVSAENSETGYGCEFLTDIVEPERISFAEAQREQFSQDASPRSPRLPDAVVWPATTGEVAEILAEANQRGVPVTPWSGGSGLEGNAIPVEGGVVLNTYEMDAIEARPADLQAVVGPGVVYDTLNETLATHGLRFPPGISSGDVATIGGMIATNASGFNSVRYGETRDNVYRLEVALPDGRVIMCGSDVVKTSSGYSLKDLFVGSEGTLGVVTEATISLSGRPEHRRAVLVTFPTVGAACQAVAEIIQYGLKPGAMEFINPSTVETVNAYNPSLGLPIEPMLLLEFHANNSGINEDINFARGVCDDNNSTSWTTDTDDELDRIWQARRDAYPAARNFREEWDIAMTGDVVVPISKYPDIVTLIHDLGEDLDLMCPCVGHAGDGNIHYTPLIDPGDASMVTRAETLHERIVHAAIDFGGTATGEHGIGLGKRQFMYREHGEALEVMRAIKQTIDPNGIMNPGKVLPPP